MGQSEKNLSLVKTTPAPFRATLEKLGYFLFNIRSHRVTPKKGEFKRMPPLDC